MNETLNLLNQRRSLRRFDPAPLREDEKETILNGAMQAPTAGAMMLYSIIEVENIEKKKALAENCDHQPFIAEAPYLLLFLADYQRWMDYYRYCDAESVCPDFDRTPRTPTEGDFMLACMDALIAAQNSVIAAESIGIGSCYIGDIIENYEKNRELFDLPRYTAPIALLCFGHPAEDQLNRRKPERFSREYIVHTDSYHCFSDEALAKMMPDSLERRAQAINPMARLNPGQHNYIRKFTAPFSLEMTRSIRAILQNWKED